MISDQEIGEMRDKIHSYNLSLNPSQNSPFEKFQFWKSKHTILENHCK